MRSCKLLMGPADGAPAELLSVGPFQEVVSGHWVCLDSHQVTSQHAWQCVAVHGSVWQCVAVFGSVWQCLAVYGT